MPIYEYVCESCQRSFERLVRSAEDARAVRCPDCGAGRAQRVPSVFAAHQAPERSAPPPGGCGQCGRAGGPCMMGD